MDLSTKYLGLKLKSPVIVGSSTFTGSVEGVKNCAAAGAGAVVLKSLFEEQILADIKKEEGYTDIYDAMPDAHRYMTTFLRGNEIELYVKLIRESKKAVDIPVIASINCTDLGEWTAIAKEFQDAGADAIELNIAIFPFDRNVKAEAIEDEAVAILKAVKKSVTIPVSVKIGSHFTNICNFAFRLAQEGADGLVLFNRFYNTDIDIETVKVIPGNALSVPEENSDTLRWISLLSSKKIPSDLSASTGVFCGNAVAKQLLAGASSVQLCSTLYKNGLSHVSTVLSELKDWMSRHNYNTVKDFKGLLNSDDDVKVFERLQYLRRNYDMN